MDNQVLLTVIILALISIMFIFASINSKRVPEKKKEKILEKLDELKTQSESDELIERRDVVIKLDNLLTKSLQLRYKNDNNCADNLIQAKSLFLKKQYQEVWDIHKLRNNIVHKDYELSRLESQNAYKIYKMTINKLLR